MGAWLFQDHRQRLRLGDKAPWSVGYIDPAGKRRSKRIGPRSLAERFARKVEGEIASGAFVDRSRATWTQFIHEFEVRALAVMGNDHRELTKVALNHFERIIKPVRISAIDSRTLDTYVAARRLEKTRGNKKEERDGRPISAATINRELRHLRLVLRKAARWKYLAECPEFQFLREPGRIPTFVTPEHFAALYEHADAATEPDGLCFKPGDWWRALLTLCYLTGWRIGQILELRRADVDLDAATALSRAEHNKGKRDQRLPLHPLIVEHLRAIPSLGERALPFDTERSRSPLYRQFRLIQLAAGIKPDGKRFYGFHDLRRAFATLNADRLTADALQALMQHKSYTTTQRYINMGRQLNTAVEQLYVPPVNRLKVIG